MGTFMDFFSFNQKAKRYIYLHMISAVLIISWPMLTVFLFRLDYSLIDVGLFFSISGIIEVVLTYGAGRILDRIPCNYGMAIIEFFSALATLIYGLSQTYYHILLGRVVEKVGWVFNPSYAVYENEAFREDYESLYQYHIMLPEIVQLVAFPLFGFLLTYVFWSLTAFRTLFIVLGLANFSLLIYIMKGLPRVEPRASITRFHLTRLRGVYLVIFSEIMLVFGEAIGSQFVLIYYILTELGGTFFSVTLVEAVVSSAIIFTTLITLKRKPQLIRAARYGIVFMMMYALLMSWAPSVLVILIAYFLYSIGQSLWFPRHRTLLMNALPPEKRGELLGTLSALNKLACIIAPLIGAFVAVRIYILAPFIIHLCTLIIVFSMYRWIGASVRS